MIIYKCDRCKKEKDPFDIVQICLVNYAHWKNDIIKPESSMISQQDFCRECADFKIDEFQGNK